jgi:hypothetical protein
MEVAGQVGVRFGEGQQHEAIFRRKRREQLAGGNRHGTRAWNRVAAREGPGDFRAQIEARLAQESHR